MWFLFNMVVEKNYQKILKIALPVEHTRMYFFLKTCPGKNVSSLIMRTYRYTLEIFVPEFVARFANSNVKTLNTYVPSFRFQEIRSRSRKFYDNFLQKSTWSFFQRRGLWKKDVFLLFLILFDKVFFCAPNSFFNSQYNRRKFAAMRCFWHYGSLLCLFVWIYFYFYNCQSGICLYRNGTLQRSEIVFIKR